jgi:hypothetical protein
MFYNNINHHHSFNNNNDNNNNNHFKNYNNNKNNLLLLSLKSNNKIIQIKEIIIIKIASIIFNNPLNPWNNINYKNLVRERINLKPLGILSIVHQEINSDFVGIKR